MKKEQSNQPAFFVKKQQSPPSEKDKDKKQACGYADDLQKYKKLAEKKWDKTKLKFSKLKLFALATKLNGLLEKYCFPQNRMSFGVSTLSSIRTLLERRIEIHAKKSDAEKANPAKFIFNVLGDCTFLRKPVDSLNNMIKNLEKHKCTNAKETKPAEKCESLAAEVQGLLEEYQELVNKYDKKFEIWFNLDEKLLKDFSEEKSDKIMFNF